ncbi:MAG: hypothetical protein EAZ52_03965 [Alphaproteobacteria bacterium]|nr:MAG: hypothetical protein EAZ66_01005 [Alphaproteobacteria bacterium]TAF76505.1 MAG: hypothetical protein EAZ52_03965 [Alphaproteobacteria bacterium]
MNHTINWNAIGIIIAMIGNMGAGIWYASQLSARVEVLEKRTSNMHTDRELLVRIDERTRAMAEAIGELKQNMGGER